MIAVTTASQAWVQAAAILCVAGPLYLIWLFKFVRTQNALPSDRTRQSSAAGSFPSACGPTSRRGSSAGTDTACPVVLALAGIGAEFQAVDFSWPINTEKDQ